MCESESIVIKGEASVVTFPANDSAAGSFDIKGGKSGGQYEDQAVT